MGIIKLLYFTQYTLITTMSCGEELELFTGTWARFDENRRFKKLFFLNCIEFKWILIGREIWFFYQ